MISQRLRVIFDFVSVKDEFQTCILTVIGMYVLLFFLEIGITLFQNKSMYKGNRNIKLFSLDRLYRTDFSYFIQNEPTKVASELNMICSKVSTFFNSVVNMVAVIIQFAVYFYIIIKVNLTAGMLSLVFMPLVYLATLGVSKKLSDCMLEFRNYNSNFYAKSLETLQLSKNIKAKNAEKFFCDRFENQVTQANNSMIKYSVFQSYSSSILGLIISIAPITILFVLINFDFIKGISQQEIMVLYLFIPLLLGAFNRLYDCFLQSYSNKPYIDQLKKFTQLNEEPSGTEELKSFDSLRTENLIIKISEDKVIKIPDISIDKGQKVLVKGESGIGKSSLFNILLGLRNEYDGCIEINGKDIRKFSKESIRRIIGLSIQDSRVYSMSIEENIKLNKDVDVSSLVDMMELNKLCDEKNGSVITSSNISGGEKSRISMAQNIAQKPEVILLDESTTSVDEDMEERIIKKMVENYQELTMICISHRKSAEKYFHKIIQFS